MKYQAPSSNLLKQALLSPVFASTTQDQALSAGRSNHYQGFFRKLLSTGATSAIEPHPQWFQVLGTGLPVWAHINATKYQELRDGKQQLTVGAIYLGLGSRRLPKPSDPTLCAVIKEHALTFVIGSPGYGLSLNGMDLHSPSLTYGIPAPVFQSTITSVLYPPPEPDHMDVDDELRDNFSEAHAGPVAMHDGHTSAAAIAPHFWVTIQSVIESLLMTQTADAASLSTNSCNVDAPSTFAMTHIAFSAGCNICFDMLYEHQLLPANELLFQSSHAALLIAPALSQTAWVKLVFHAKSLLRTNFSVTILHSPDVSIASLCNKRAFGQHHYQH